MADLTLGLDLGPNSIGWALLDEQGQRIVATGVRVFPEGVDRDAQGAELSKNETRRRARAARRQIARRARRKRELRKALVAAGLLPACALPAADAAPWVDWMRSEFQKEDPYSLRRRALDDRLEPYEIGRAILHLGQRRGFLSNRRADRAKKKEESQMLQEISELAGRMGDRTLGQYFSELQRTDPHGRLRGHHTRRQMYLDEFDRIWGAQQRHHPALLTQELKERIHRIIFFQRAMYWPASMVGRCELEPRLARCPRADRRAQRFRLLQEVNNLRLLDTTTGEERGLSESERSRLLAYLCGARERSFDQIRKHLFAQYEGIRFNLERGDRDKLKGMPTDAILAHKSLFGKAWHDKPENAKNRLVGALIEGDEASIRTAAAELELEPDRIEALLDVNLEEGYASYSLHAIKNLLPHLERGLPLTSRDGSACALREAGYVLPWEQTVGRQPHLPEPPFVTNPLVRQALHEVRKVVNAVLRELVCRAGHRLARIHIELAREVRGTAEQRRKRMHEMRDRERARIAAAEEIRAAGVKPTREAIDRYLLWEEQRRECVYSGKPIGLVQLLGGEVDVDHILPYSRSLDNSLMNKVVCFRSENSQGVSLDAKGDRTPYEWLASANPAKYDQVLQRADRLPYAKARRFRQKSVDLEDFFARQLVDTTYITTQVHRYVQCLGADVVCVKGQHTADLRHFWGLDGVLRDDGLGLKNREDHRHHAVDAITIALTDRRRLQQLARIRRGSPGGPRDDALPEPWPQFREAVEAAVNAINVSHRVSRKVSGPLHEDTIYGPTRIPGEFACRKPLEALTLDMVRAIRDPVIRQLVVSRLRAHGIDPDAGNAKIPAAVWKEPLCMASGVRVSKVRLIRRDLTIRPLRGRTACVKPGSLHHLCIFEVTDPKGRTRREAVFVSMLEAMNRLRMRVPVISRTHPSSPDARFVMSLSRGEMLLGTFAGQEHLVSFRTAASTQGQIYCMLHTDARPSGVARKLVANANTLRARKVTVDPIGRIRWAND